MLAAREPHPERSLAEHDNRLAMAPKLLKAHRALDVVVDKAFGLKALVDEAARLTALFASNAKLTAAETLPIPKTRGRRAR